MLAFPCCEAFKADVMSAFPFRPKSFSHIIASNLKGATTLDACPMDKRLTPPQFEEMVADSGSGYRSNIAASILRKAGYSKVSSLAGGLFAWSNGGFPSVT